MASNDFKLDAKIVEDYERDLSISVYSFKTHPKKVFIKDFGFRILFTLRTLKPDWDLLKAAAAFWDCDSHTFNFSANEMVPTVDDFGVILGMPLVGRITVPKYHRGVVDSWVGLLNLSVGEVKRMLHGTVVDITELPMFFSLHSEDAGSVF